MSLILIRRDDPEQTVTLVKCRIGSTVEVALRNLGINSDHGRQSADAVHVPRFSLGDRTRRMRMSETSWRCKSSPRTTF